MSTTNKLLAGAAILVAAYAGSSWYVGKKAEAEINHQVNEINAAIATQLALSLGEGEIKLNVVDYDRGWFSSKVNYEVRIKSAKDEQFQFLAQDHLRHGPFPFAAIAKGHIAPLLAYSDAKLLPTKETQPLFDAAKGEEPLRAHSFISFGGATKTVIDLAAIDYRDEDGNQVLMAKSEGQVDYVRKGGKEQADFTMTFPSLSLVVDEGDLHVQLNGMRANGSITEQDKAQASEGELHIDQLGINVENSTQVFIENIKTASSYEVKDGLLDSMLTYDFGKILADKQDLGQMQLDVGVKRLDYVMLNQLSQVDDLDSMDEDELLPMIKQILVNKPEVYINNFMLSNPAGSSTLTSDVRFATTALDPVENEELDLGHYVESLNADIRLSRQMIKGYFSGENMISSMADMFFNSAAEEAQEAGLVEYDGNEAKLALSFDAATNKLLLNNKPISVEELVQILFSMQMGGGLF